MKRIYAIRPKVVRKLIPHRPPNTHHFLFPLEHVVCIAKIPENHRLEITAGQAMLFGDLGELCLCALRQPTLREPAAAYAKLVNLPCDFVENCVPMTAIMHQHAGGADMIHVIDVDFKVEDVDRWAAARGDAGDLNQRAIGRL